MKLASAFVRCVAFALLALTPMAAQADTPAQKVVQNLYSQLVATMKQGEQLGFAGRYKKLDPVLRESFNFPLMARVATGSSWSTASTKEQSDIADAFSAFSISTYASRFSAFDGEVFAVTGEKPSGADTIVETTLKPKVGEAIVLNYLMRRDEKGAYRIVDVMMNGTISELATRRAEFSSVARREGIPALIEGLNKKAKHMATTAP